MVRGYLQWDTWRRDGEASGSVIVFGESVSIQESSQRAGRIVEGERYIT